MISIGRKKMTNKKIWMGMLALALMFGMTVVGCGDDGSGGGGSTALDGTWSKPYSGGIQEVSLNGSNWSLKNDGTNRARGTITLSDPNTTTGSASFTVKEGWDGSRWEPMTNQTATVNYVMGSQKTTIMFSNIVGSGWFNTLEGTWTKK
jgi:hypothetical protein